MHQSTRPAAAQINPALADLARLSIKDIAGVARCCEQSIRNKIRAGKFPPPDHRDGPRCVRWSVGVVRQWLESTRTEGGVK